MDSKAKCHVRSISLPSRTHPLTSSVEEQFYKLRTLQAKSTSSSSSSLRCRKLGGLKELYGRVDDLLQLPLTQQAISHERHGKWAEDVFDGSLRLLDMCGTTRDVFSQMKECVQQLEPSLRRRKGGESSLENDIGAYMISRKKLNKVISKCFTNLKRMENNCCTSDSDLMAVVGMLREVEDISFNAFESLLSSVSQPKVRSRLNSWSVVSKLLHPKRVSCEAEVEANEVEKIDAELLNLKSSKNINLVKVEKVLKGLKVMELTIQEAEEELECVFRQLVIARVSLLNIFNH
ncbi:hypothetical protein ACOSQ4_011390 [Xanthoceras sorbifolium]